MERYPLRILDQYEARCNHKFRKVVWFNPHLLVPLQVDARLLEQV